MAEDHGTNADSDNEGKDHTECGITVLDKAKRKEEHEIQKRKDDWEPGIGIHHGNAKEIADPTLFGSGIFGKEIKDTVDNDVDVKRNDDTFYDSLADKTLEIVLLTVIAFQKTIT